MKKIALYLYDGYYETEVCIPALLFKDKGLFTVSSDQDVIKCVDGKKVVADYKLSDLDPKDIDVLIIPGGKPILKDDILDFIRKCDENGAVIGGICGGVDFIAKSGILKGRTYTMFKEEIEGATKTDKMYESDKNVVSSKPEAYLEFAIELYNLAGFEVTKDDENGLIEWFKTPYCWNKEQRI